MYLSFFTPALVSSASFAATAQLTERFPTDPASIFVLLLTLGAAGAVMWFGRPRGGGGMP